MSRRFQNVDLEAADMQLLGVGIATVDEIHTVERFPQEDTKVRSLHRRQSRGGNVTNALVVSAQLGAKCAWMGTSTDPETDSDAALVHEDLRTHGVDTSLATILPSGSMPASFILVSQDTGSRTIVHSRDLPELSCASFTSRTSELSPAEPTWFHFEGRNWENVGHMLRHVRSVFPSAVVSVEVEALRNQWVDIQTSVAMADYVFLSKDYLRENLCCPDAKTFLDKMVVPKDWERIKTWILPWGPDGVHYIDSETKTLRSMPTTPVADVVESVGAGDSFIGATLAALTSNASLEQALRLACDVAGQKCSQQGFSLPPARLQEWTRRLE